MIRARPVLVVLLVIFLTTPLAFGDRLVLKNGNSFEGKLVRETATHYYFKVKGMGEMPFKKADVDRIEESKSVYDEYAERRKALSDDDADGHYELGVWCRENGLRKESKAEFEAAVAADPDHAKARDELGFANYEGEWITKERRDEILAEIAKREGEILAGLSLGAVEKNTQARFKFRPPNEWEKNGESEQELAYRGPVLGKAPVMIGFTAESADGDLDAFAKGVAKEVKKDHENASQGEPADAKLAGESARLLSFSYVRDDLAAQDLDMELRVLIAATDAGNFRFWIECRQGYFERLKPFFDKVAGTLEILDKPPDFVSEEHGYSFAFPDDTYKKEGEFPIRGPNGESLIQGVEVLVKSRRAMFMVIPGEEGDGKADLTSLDTLKEAVPKLCPIGGFLQLAGNEKHRTVDGVDAITGNIKVLGGGIGGGRFCVFKKGKRYFRLLFVNFLNMMGDQYVDEDFGKFLDGFTVQAE